MTVPTQSELQLVAEVLNKIQIIKTSIGIAQDNITYYQEAKTYYFEVAEQPLDQKDEDIAQEASLSLIRFTDNLNRLKASRAILEAELAILSS